MNHLLKCDVLFDKNNPLGIGDDEHQWREVWINLRQCIAVSMYNSDEDEYNGKGVVYFGDTSFITNFSFDELKKSWILINTV